MSSIINIACMQKGVKMDDLVSRAEAQTEIQMSAKRMALSFEAHGEGYVVYSEDVIKVSDTIDALRNLPSAQPEQKTGKWKHISDGYVDIYECDQCRETEDYERNYCPNCGAMMSESLTAAEIGKEIVKGLESGVRGEKDEV